MCYIISILSDIFPMCFVFFSCSFSSPLLPYYNNSISMVSSIYSSFFFFVCIPLYFYFRTVCVENKSIFLSVYNEVVGLLWEFESTWSFWLEIVRRLNGCVFDSKWESNLVRCSSFDFMLKEEQNCCIRFCRTRSKRTSR